MGSVVPVITGGHTGACGLGHQWEPCWCPRVVLPIWMACKATWGSGDCMTQAAIEDHGLWSYHGQSLF